MTRAAHPGRDHSTKPTLANLIVAYLAIRIEFIRRGRGRRKVDKSDAQCRDAARSSSPINSS